MNFATWRLDFSDPDYGTGPEAKLLSMGFEVEPSWANGEVQLGATILGYVSGIADESLLAKWDYKNISELEALEFAQTIHPNAKILDGRIVTED